MEHARTKKSPQQAIPTFAETLEPLLLRNSIRVWQINLQIVVIGKKNVVLSLAVDILPIVTGYVTSTY